MLGFPSSNARIYDKTTNFDGKGPVWIRFNREEGCNGDETHLDQCKTQNLWEHDQRCDHIEDVGVTCE